MVSFSASSSINKKIKKHLQVFLFPTESALLFCFYIDPNNPNNPYNPFNL